MVTGIQLGDLSGSPSQAVDQDRYVAVTTDGWPVALIVSRAGFCLTLMLRVDRGIPLRFVKTAACSLEHA